MATGALAQEREWVFMTNETDAFLGFGVPESDDSGITFSCTMLSGDIRMFIAEGRAQLVPGNMIQLGLRAGGKDFNYRAEVLPNEEAGIPSLQAGLTPDDPLFTTLKSSDRFGIVIDGEAEMFPLAGSDFDSLLRVCRKSA